MSAIWRASLLLQGFRAGSRVGFAVRRKARPSRCGDERPHRCARRTNGPLLAQKVTIARSGSAPELSSERPPNEDRKSTRLNSSHTVISYAVFCLKKKKK